MNATARILAGRALADASLRLRKAAVRLADADMEPRGQAEALSMAEKATTDADYALRELHDAEAPTCPECNGEGGWVTLISPMDYETERCDRCHGRGTL